MQEELLQTPKEPERKHNFLPRFIGLVAGTISSYFMGNFLLNKSLHRWVNARLYFGEDTVVKNVRKGIDAGLMPGGPLSPMKKKLDELLKKSLEKKAEKEVIQKPIIEKLEAEKRGIDAIIESAGKGKFTLTAKQLEHTGIKATELGAAIESAKNKVENNFRYFHGRAEAKIINPEIIKRLQLGLRQAEHIRWIFVGGTAALGVVGYATYKITDRLMNGKEKTHSQAIINRRATAAAAENGESAPELR